MNNFEKNWQNAKISILRLEGRPEYKLTGGKGNVKKGKLGEPNIMSDDKEWMKWSAAVASAKTKGVKVQRVRVVPEPLSDYIQQQIKIWQKYPAKNREELFFIDSEDYAKIIAESRFSLKDFWLFDDEKLLILNYNTAGLPAGDILIGDGSMIRIYCELKRKMMQKAVPFNIFTKK